MCIRFFNNNIGIFVFQIWILDSSNPVQVLDFPQDNYFFQFSFVYDLSLRITSYDFPFTLTCPP